MPIGGILGGLGALGNTLDGTVPEGDLAALQQLERVGASAGRANQHTAHGVGAAAEVNRQTLSGKVPGLNLNAVSAATLQQRHGVAVLGLSNGLLQGGELHHVARSGQLRHFLSGLQRQRLGALPLECGDAFFDVVAAGILHGRTGGQTRVALAVGCTIHRGVQASRLALRRVVIHDQVELGVGAEVHTHVLGVTAIRPIRIDGKRIVGGGDGGIHLPLGNALKLHGARAGDRVVSEGDLRQRAEVIALPLVVALSPVAVGRADPSGVGTISINSIGIISEGTTVELQRPRGDSAHDDAFEGAVLKVQASQLAPRRSIQLIVKAHHVLEGYPLKGDVGIGGHRQQQGRADVVDAGVAPHSAGDGTLDEHNVVAVGAIVALTQIAVLGISVQLGVIGSLPRRVIPHAVAQHTIRGVGIVANFHVHGAAQTLLRSDVLRTGHLTELLQRVGCLRRTGIVRQERTLDANGQLLRSVYRLFHTLVEVHRYAAVRFVIAGLLRQHPAFGVLHRQAQVVGLLTRAAITNKDIAVIANRTGKGAAVNGGIHRAAAAVDEADRRRKARPTVLIAAVGELAALDLHGHSAGGLVVDVHGNRCAREGAAIDNDRAVRVGVNRRLRRQEIAAGQRDVIHSSGAADVHALDVFLARDRLAVAASQAHIHLIGGVPLTPHAQIVQLIGVDGDILIEIHTTRLDLLAGIAAEHVGIDLQVALATGDVGVVAVNGDVVRHVAVGHGAHIRTGTAHDGDVARVGLIRRGQRIGQLGRITGLLTSRPVHGSGRIPHTLVQQLQSVVLRAQCRKRSFQRGIHHAADLSDLRSKHLFAIHGHSGVLVGVSRLLLVVPQGTLAVGTLSKTRSRSLASHRDRSTILHEAGVDLDSCLALDRSTGNELGVLHRQVSLGVRAFVVHQHRLTHAIEGAAIELNILCTIRPDVISVLVRLLEGAAIERLVRGIQEHHSVYGAFVVHQRIGVLQANVVAIGLVVKYHTFKGDLCAMQSHCLGHIEGNIHAVSSLDGERLTRIGQAAIQRVLASVDHNGTAILNGLDSIVQSIVLHSTDLGNVVLHYVAVRVLLHARSQILRIDLRAEGTAGDGQSVVGNVSAFDVRINKRSHCSADAAARDLSGRIGGFTSSINIAGAVVRRIQNDLAAGNAYLAVFRVAILHANLNSLCKGVLAADREFAIGNIYGNILLYAVLTPNKHANNIVSVTVRVKVNVQFKFAASYVDRRVVIGNDSRELCIRTGHNDLAGVEVHNCRALLCIGVNGRVDAVISVNLHITVNDQFGSGVGILIEDVNAITASCGAIKNILARAAAVRQRQLRIVDNNAVTARLNGQRFAVDVESEVLIDRQRLGQRHVAQQRDSIACAGRGDSRFKRSILIAAYLSDISRAALALSFFPASTVFILIRIFDSIAGSFADLLSNASGGLILQFLCEYRRGQQRDQHQNRQHYTDQSATDSLSHTHCFLSSFIAVPLIRCGVSSHRGSQHLPCHCLFTDVAHNCISLLPLYFAVRFYRFSQRKCCLCRFFARFYRALPEITSIITYYR